MDKIHHVAIQVKNIKIAVKWYIDKFDASLDYEDETWALLKFDNLSLALVMIDQHPPHFAIESKNAGDFGHLTKHRDGTASVYIKDPSGNVVEIIEIE